MITEKSKPIAVSREKVTAPKFKGRTKIELFENGRKVSEQTDNNMMTNMLQKVFNPKRLFADSTTLGNLYQNHIPLYSAALGGVLLYEKTIDENAETSLAPITNRCVGHAGGTYGGSQSTRGTLNESESGFIDPDAPWKGYRLVWDFPTDKANGTISCVCLTSRTGGNSGYGAGIDYAVTEDNNYFAAELANLNGNNRTFGLRFIIKGTSSMLGTNNLFAYLGESEDGFSRFVYLSSTSQLVFIEISTEKLDIGISDEFNGANGRVIDWSNLGKDTPSYRINQYSLPFTLTSNSRTSAFIKDGKWYIVSHTSATQFSYTIFDPVTRSFSSVESRTISPGYYYNRINTVCKAGKYWFAIQNNGTDLYRYPENGGTGELVGTIPVNGTSFQEVSGELVWMYNNSTGYFKVFDPEEPTNYFAKTNSGYQVFTGTSQIADSGANRSVLMFLTVTTNSSLNQIAIVIDSRRITGYLATINNLSSPVTKSSAQTMKITYEITPEERED